MKKRGNAMLLTISVLIVATTLAISGCTFDFPTSSGSTTSTYTTYSSTSSSTVSSSEDREIVKVVINGYNLEKSENNSLADVVEKIAGSVVEVYAERSDGISAGSGVVIGIGDVNSNSYIVTCHHVIKGFVAITVKDSNGNDYPATLVGTDDVTDIAVLKIDAVLSKVEAGFDISALRAGDVAIVIGNALGVLGGTVTNGIISSTSRDITIDGQKMKLLQTNAAINEGNSGGGLFNEDGCLIGIVNAGYKGTGVEGLGLAIPIDVVLPIMKELSENGYVAGRYKLGITFSDNQGYVTGGGWNPIVQHFVQVVDIDESGSMYKAGIRISDRVLSVSYGDQYYAVTNAEGLSNFLNSLSYKIGDVLKVTVSRRNIGQTYENRDFDVPILQYIYGK